MNLMFLLELVAFQSRFNSCFEDLALIPPDSWHSQKWRLRNAKPRLKRDKFTSDKFVKIEFRNPTEIEKTLWNFIE